MLHIYLDFLDGLGCDKMYRSMLLLLTQAHNFSPIDLCQILGGRWSILDNALFPPVYLQYKHNSASYRDIPPIYIITEKIAKCLIFNSDKRKMKGVRFLNIILSLWDTKKRRDKKTYTLRLPASLQTEHACSLRELPARK